MKGSSASGAAMFRVAVTGGIGTGKSYVCRLLEMRGIQIYDCDAAAKHLMRHSHTLQARLSELIGEKVADEHGLKKALLSRYLLASEDNQARVNAIVHPAVIDDFLHSGYAWMESAILFESGYSYMVDYVVSVSCPDRVRMGRICRRDGISMEQAEQWLARQWPQQEVIRRSHYNIINDGTEALAPQIEQLLKHINQYKEQHNTPQQP